MRMRTTVGIIAGLTLVAAGCGGDDAPSSDATSAPAVTAGPPATAGTTPPAATAGPATAGAPTNAAATGESAPPTTPDDGLPDAIVSLSPTATEMLYAIGAGDRVVAVDDFSNYPAETADKMLGFNGFEPNVEAIAGIEPDLVVTDGTNPEFLAQLDSLGIAHWEGRAAIGFDDVYTQIEQLGAQTGHVAEAAELVGQMQADITAIVAGLPQLAEPLTYYHELDESYFTVSTNTFIGAVYGEIGLRNIVDLTETAGEQYPQLNAEFIISADPDLIFLACTKYCTTTAESVAARPGWDAIAAVRDGGVIEMDDDIASRWGPRIVDYLRIAGDAVRAAAALQGAG